MSSSPNLGVEPTWKKKKKSLQRWGVLIFFFLTFIYFWDRERQSMNGGGAEREGDTELEAGSRLWAISPEPDAGLELTVREIVTWAEVGRSTDWATQAPQIMNIFDICYSQHLDGHFLDLLFYFSFLDSISDQYFSLCSYPHPPFWFKYVNVFYQVLLKFYLVAFSYQRLNWLISLCCGELFI